MISQDDIEAFREEGLHPDVETAFEYARRLRGKDAVARGIERLAISVVSLMRERDARDAIAMSPGEPEYK